MSKIEILGIAALCLMSVALFIHIILWIRLGIITLIKSKRGQALPK